MKTISKEVRYLLDIRSGEIVREIPEDICFYSTPGFACGVELVYQEKTDKLALINQDFELITEFIFDHVDSFSENLAAAEIDGKWGYIDLSGDFVIEPQYKNASDFKNGLAKIQDPETERYGFIDKTGKIIIGYYDYLGNFSEGLVYAQNKGSDSFHYLNENGDVMLTMKYPIGDTSNHNTQELIDFALQEFDSCVGCCLLEDMGFSMVNDVMYERRNLKLCEFHDGLCQFIENTDQGVKIGFYDKSGRIVIPAEFDFASRFYNGISFYSNGNNIYDCKSGILTNTGERIETGDFYWDTWLEYDKHDKLFAIRANKRNGIPNANGKYGFVDRNGEIIVSPCFDKVYSFNNGMIVVEMGLLCGYVNDDGDYVIPAEYDNSFDFDEHGLCIVSKYNDNNRVVDGIIDKSGKIIAPLVFEDIEIISKERFYAKAENGCILYDITGKPVKKNVFGELTSIYENHAIVKLHLSENKLDSTKKIFRGSCGEGRYLYFYECYPGCAEEHGHGFGLMKEDGTILTPQMFEHIGYYSEGLICGEARGYDYFDLEGTPVLFNFHDTCSDFVDGIAYIVTHNWAHGSLVYHRGDNKLLRFDKVINGEPLINNKTTFFMNKHGDIINPDPGQQEEFLRKYFEMRDKRALMRNEWSFEEYVK